MNILMKFSKAVMVLALGGILVSSCKDDDDSSSTYYSLSGSLSVGAEMPSYVNPGDVFNFESSGVSLPESETDEDVKLYFTYKNSVDNVKDTVSTYTVTIPEMLGEYTVTATAEASGYYTKTVTQTTTVVSAKSLTGCDRSSLSQVTDSRDGKQYRQVTVNGKWWFAENLAYYEKDADGNYTFGSSYEAVKATEDIMGGFYSWEDAQTACPSGWRLPTLEEWNALGDTAGDFMCDAYFNGSRLWEFWPDVKVTNKLNLYLMPFGYATVVDGEYTFTGFNDYAFYWVNDGGKPKCKYIYVATPKVLNWEDPSETDFAAQVRCVKE